MQEKNKIDRNEAKIQFFEIISKINKLLAILIRKRGRDREKTQIANIRNERDNFTTDSTVIKRIIRA